jgi:hypothetical protein
VLSFQGNNLNIEKNGQLNECAICSQLVMCYSSLGRKRTEQLCYLVPGCTVEFAHSMLIYGHLCVEVNLLDLFKFTYMS